MAHDAPANSKTHAYAKPRHPPRHRNPRARPGVARRPPGRCLLAEAPVLSAVAPVVAAVFASVAPAVDAVSDDHGTAEGGRQSVPQAAARRRTVRRWLLSQFLSHSPPSGAVHQCSLGWCLCSSRTVADAGERWPALLESVLGPVVEICVLPLESERFALPSSERQGHDPACAAGDGSPGCTCAAILTSTVRCRASDHRDRPGFPMAAARTCRAFRPVSPDHTWERSPRLILDNCHLRPLPPFPPRALNAHILRRRGGAHITRHGGSAQAAGTAPCRQA